MQATRRDAGDMGRRGGAGDDIDLQAGLDGGQVGGGIPATDDVSGVQYRSGVCAGLHAAWRDNRPREELSRPAARRRPDTQRSGRRGRGREKDCRPALQVQAISWSGGVRLHSRGGDAGYVESGFVGEEMLDSGMRGKTTPKVGVARHTCASREPCSGCPLSRK